ncbi:MAG: Trk system potassium transporter TrkA [Bacillota bacterium]|nr:Trk system potassium transporter TrkA [Bacillota bacterium]
MKIVIVGNGKVGHTLAGMLSREGHDIVVIDSSSESFRTLEADHDVIYLQGSALSYELQKQAGVGEADVLIAVTSTDEVNVLCCLIARKLGAKNTIARVRDPEFENQLHIFKNELGLSQSVNPEKNTATEITRILHNPNALKIDSFAGGRIEMVELKISEECPLAGRKIKDFHIKGLTNFMICAVERENEVYIPNGDFVVESGDKVHVSVETDKLSMLFRGFKMDIKPLKNILIVGGGKISYYLSKMLIENHMNVTIIEKNEERCKFLSSQFDNLKVVFGDASKESTLADVDFKNTDAFVALTNIDEENLVMSLYAGYHKCRKVITKVNRLSYLDAFQGTAIDTVISPKMLVSQEMLKMVRAIAASGESSIRALYKIGDIALEENSAEALEFEALEDTKYLGVPLMDLPIKKNILLVCISRKNKTIIPKGADCIKKGDIVVLVTKDRIINSLNEIFA